MKSVALKALAAKNIKTKAGAYFRRKIAYKQVPLPPFYLIYTVLCIQLQHRAPAAPRAPQLNQPHRQFSRRQQQPQQNVLPSHQIADDPYAFDPSDYADHVPASQAEEQPRGFANSPPPSPSHSLEEDAIEEEEEEEAASPAAENSPSDWEPSSESDDAEVEEEKPAEKNKVVTMARKKTPAATTAPTTTTTATASKKSTVASGPDSSFAVYLSGNNTVSAATTSKLPSSNTRKVQQNQQPPTLAAAAAPPTVAPATAPAEAKPKKKKKLTFADQAALPIMIPKSVARDPSSNAIIIEIPPGVDLAGASGVIGRIVGGAGAGGNRHTGSDSSGDSEEQATQGGLILDLMGTRYSTEVIKLPNTLAVAHLTGDRFIVDSILSTAVRTTALDPGNESAYSMEFDSDESDYKDDTFTATATAGGGGGANSSSLVKKKGRGGGVGARGGGAARGRKNFSVGARKKTGGRGVKKPASTNRKRATKASKKK